MNTLTKGAAPMKRATTHTRPPLRELVEAIDLPRLVEQYAGPGKKQGKHYAFRCPNPAHADTHPSFVAFFAPQRRRWLCVCNSACGQIGDAFDFVKWVRGCDDREAATELRRFAGEPDNFARPYRHKPTRPEATSPLTEVTAPAALDDRDTLARYLEGRAWPEWVAERFGLTVVADRFGAKRVRHPFYAFATEGEVLRVIEAGSQARALDPRAKVRWLGDEGVALPLYNLTALEADTVRAVVLCEGPADTISATIAAEACGLDGVACVGVPGVQAWGTSAKAEWVKWLSGLFVLVAGDNDAAGEHFAAQVAADLEGVAAGVSVVVPSPGDDLGEMLTEVGPGEVGALFAQHLEALGAVADV